MKKEYDYIVYKTTEISTGKIYVGYDSYNRLNYFGSGTYFLNAMHIRLKEYKGYKLLDKIKINSKND